MTRNDQIENAKETTLVAKTHILANHTIRVELNQVGLSYVCEMKIDGRQTTALESHSTRVEARYTFDLMNEMVQSLVAVIGK
jgi:hypothetical protein